MKSQLKELHVIFACDEDHRKVFPDVTIIGFKSNKNLKSHLVRATLPDINKVGRWEPCGGKRPPCQLYSKMRNTSTFKRRLLNCAPSRLRALAISDKRLRAYVSYPSLIRTLCACAPLSSSISALGAFFLSCVVLFQLKGKIPMFCVCAPINHSHLPLSSLLFCHIKLFYMLLVFVLF